MTMRFCVDNVLFDVAYDGYIYRDVCIIILIIPIDFIWW